LRSRIKRNLAIGATVLSSAAFVGGAYAATQQGSPAATRQAFLSDVAKRLGVTPAQLNAALQGARDDQLQAAVAAGKLTQAQANALKQRTQQGGLPPLGKRWFGGGPGRVGGTGSLAAAATYLGIAEDQLVAQLRGGKTLAQIAKAHGKSTSGLKSALATNLKTQLDKAVANKVITSEQERKLLARLSSRIDGEINGTGPGPGIGMHGTFQGWGAGNAPRHPWGPGGGLQHPGRSGSGSPPAGALAPVLPSIPGPVD
jgi:transposase-like protein